MTKKQKKKMKIISKILDGEEMSKVDFPEDMNGDDITFLNMHQSHLWNSREIFLHLNFFIR